MHIFELWEEITALRKKPVDKGKTCKIWCSEVYRSKKTATSDTGLILRNICNFIQFYEVHKL